MSLPNARRPGVSEADLKLSNEIGDTCVWSDEYGNPRFNVTHASYLIYRYRNQVHNDAVEACATLFSDEASLARANGEVSYAIDVECDAAAIRELKESK